MEKTKRNLYAGIMGLVSLIGSSGCQTDNVRIGKYTMSKASYHSLEEFEENIDNKLTKQDFIEFIEKYDSNSDNHISIDECAEGIHEIGEIMSILGGLP